MSRLPMRVTGVGHARRLPSLLILAVGSLIASMSSGAGATAIDLSSWITNSGPADASWEVQTGNDSVLQTVNGAPSIFYDPLNLSAQGQAITGRISVGPPTLGFNDDDFIGFMLGIGSATGEFYLVDWKQGTQPQGAGCGLGTAGLAFTAFQPGFDGCRFWDHGDNPNDPLAREVRASTLGSTGWVDGIEYEFSIFYSADLIQVAVDGNLELNVAPADVGLTEFQNGGVGFYNFSQEQVLYSAIRGADCDLDPDAPECVIPGVPAPSPVFLLFLGLGAAWLGRSRA